MKWIANERKNTFHYTQKIRLCNTFLMGMNWEFCFFLGCGKMKVC